jgi:hypothetical protein
MTITEPMTMATDYLLAVICFGVSWKLLVTPERRDRSIVLWASALASTGLAALAGGTYHGFRTTMPSPADVVSWKITMIAIGLASFSFAGAIIQTLFTGRLRTLLLWVFALKLFAYFVVLTRYDDFQLAIYDYTPTMIGVLMAEFYVWWKRRGREALWIVAGILVSFIGAIIQMGGRGFHEHFNHNDIYHVVQMIGVYCFYRRRSLATGAGPGLVKRRQM